MIRHWLRTRAEGWRRRLSVNSVGAVVTALVAIDVTIVKAPASLAVIVLIPILASLMWFIHHEYETAEKELFIEARRVELVYEPPGLRAGLLLGGCGGLAAIALALIGRRRPRPRPGS